MTDIVNADADELIEYVEKLEARIRTLEAEIAGLRAEAVLRR